MSSSEEEISKNHENRTDISLLKSNRNIQKLIYPKKIETKQFMQTKSSQIRLKLKLKLLRIREKKSKSSNHIKVNVSETQYSVIEYVMKKFNYEIVKEPGVDFDLLWTDKSVSSNKVSLLKSFQKINHFPGMHCLSRKNELAINLKKIRNIFPQEFSFVPETWILPDDFSTFKFKLQCLRNSKNKKTFILKPWDGSQGKGILLIKKEASCLDRTERYVAQKYINKPYLIDNLKFDLRIYCLVYGCDPLRIFIYKEGLARFATENYFAPCEENLNNNFIHLTNYAINKHSAKFIFNSDANKPNVGHKKCLEYVWNHIDNHGGDSSKVKNDIYDCIVKTICSVQPILAQSYRTCFPKDLDDNNKCFEILGFDILIDSKLHPWLLEVNHSPSFTTDTPFDFKLKSNLIYDTIRILNLDENYELRKDLDLLGEKNQLLNVSKEQLFDKKNFKIKDLTELKELKQIKMKLRDEFENNNLGDFVKVYPNTNTGSSRSSGPSGSFDEIIKAAFTILCSENLEIRKMSLKSVRNKININENFKNFTNFKNLKNLKNLQIKNSYFSTLPNVNCDQKINSTESKLPLIKNRFTRNIFNESPICNCNCNCNFKQVKRQLIPSTINITETSFCLNDLRDLKDPKDLKDLKDKQDLHDKQAFKLKSTEMSDICSNGEENENSAKNFNLPIRNRNLLSNTSRNYLDNFGLMLTKTKTKRWIYKLGYLKAPLLNLRPKVDKIKLSNVDKIRNKNTNKNDNDNDNDNEKLKFQFKFAKSQQNPPNDFKINLNLSNLSNSSNLAMPNEKSKNEKNEKTFKETIKTNKINLIKFQNLVYQGMHPISKNDLFLNKYE